MIELTETITDDGLKLQGIHYPAKESDAVLIFVHGMAGMYFEDYYAQVLCETLQKADIGSIYSHNRGYAHINEIHVRSDEDSGADKVEEFGVIYERFADSLVDIGAWVHAALELGYERVVLCGHSLGCNKVIYYFHRHQIKQVIGVVLASPPDMVGLVEKVEYQPNHPELLKEARDLVEAGNPKVILSGKVWDSYLLSAQTYLDLFERGGPADNLPILHNPDTFEELASIGVPILCIYGEHDDVAIRTLEDDMDLIEERASSAPSFQKAWVADGNHNYLNQEEQFANLVKDWIKII